MIKWFLHLESMNFHFQPMKHVKKLVSLAGNEKFFDSKCQNNFIKMAHRSGKERRGKGKGMERKGKERKGNWSNYYISRVVGRNSYFKVWN